MTPQLQQFFDQVNINLVLLAAVAAGAGLLLGLVIGMVRSNSARESLRQEIAAVIPYEEKTVDNAINQGKPLMLENRTLPVSKSILSFAEKIPQFITANQEVDEA